jgi:hypothetical protein
LGFLIFRLYFLFRAGVRDRVNAMLENVVFALRHPRYKLLLRARRNRDIGLSSKILAELYSNSSDEIRLTRKLSVIAADLGLTDIAQHLSVTYFESTIASDMDIFLDASKAFMAPIIGDVTVGYSYSVGNENIGCLLCKSHDGITRSFGKIIKIKARKSKEALFYCSVLNEFPQIEAIVPRCFGVYERSRDHVTIIFMDALGERGLGTKRIGKSAVSIGRIIESIDYREATDIFATIPLDYSKPFGRIFHLRYGCEYALLEIRSGFLAEPSREILAIFETLENIFLRNSAHRLINRDHHYGFCHNDFHWRNLHYENGTCKVFDWSTCSIGLRGWDMATYFSDCEFSFEEISELYINDRFDLRNRQDQILLMFFCFALLLIISRRHRRNCEPMVGSFFKPALGIIKAMHNKINGVKV